MFGIAETAIYLNFILPQTQSLDREIDIWAILEHEYVLPFHGTVEGFGSFRGLVIPWMPHGNLDSYLKHAGETLTAMDRLRMVSSIFEDYCRSSLWSR
jgi:hypothetical protein